MMTICKLSFIFFNKKSKKQEGGGGTDFVLLSWSRNMIGQFLKIHLHRHSQFLTPAKIQKCEHKF